MFKPGARSTPVVKEPTEHQGNIPTTPAAILLPREAASRLSITPGLLRRLTDRGAIGHVRLGSGEQRVRIGYTERQISEFITARTVPAVPSSGLAETYAARPRPRRTGAHRTRRASADVSDVAAGLVNAALASGSVTEWRHP